MSSSLSVLLPLASLLYLAQTILRRKMSVFLKIALIIPALSMLITDVFVFLVFYMNCNHAMLVSQNAECLGWIYPTTDFLAMCIISLLLLFAAIVGVIRKWDRKIYFRLATIVIYLGFACRLYILKTSAQAIAMAPDSRNPIVLEIFSITIIYGLVSSVIYFLIAFPGILKR